MVLLALILKAPLDEDPAYLIGRTEYQKAK